MESIYTIKRPLITEKSTYEAGECNRYAFEVDIKAAKGEIKAAIESLYGVRVVKVNTQVRKGSAFRNKFGVGKTGTTKKAMVTLHSDDRIELF